MAVKDEFISELLGEVNHEKDIFGENGIIKQLAKQLLERALESEMTHHLGYDKHASSGVNTGNSRNGKSKKTVKTGTGELEIAVPRDRNGDFEPQLIGKRQTRLSGLDDQVLALYARGMTVRDIKTYVDELYDTSISPDLISTITDDIMEDVKQWRSRPLDNVYPIIFIDGFVVKCRLDGHVTNRTVYVIIGINTESYKDVLGLYIGENEGAKFWLSVLTELKNRELNDVFVVCADGLKGLPDAIAAAYPDATFQTCIVHMVRHSLNYVPHKEKKAVAEDLKKIYTAGTLELAESALDDFELIWGDKYAAIVRSWRTNWSCITPFFDYPPNIRRIIYTTNIIESLNRTLRKSVKTRGSFPTEESVFKVLYLAIKGLSKKWSMPVRGLSEAMNQFAILYPDRFVVK